MYQAKSPNSCPKKNNNNPIGLLKLTLKLIIKLKPTKAHQIVQKGLDNETQMPPKKLLPLNFLISSLEIVAKSRFNGFLYTPLITKIPKETSKIPPINPNIIKNT